MKRNYVGVLGVLILGSFSSSAIGQIKIVGGGLGGNFSRSISVTNEDGIKTTQVTENGEKFVIREGENLIEVEFSHKYGPDNLDELKQNHPDLHMHVTSFPKKSGDATVELTVSVKEKVTAENESKLKEKSEEAFAVFEKYTRNNGGLGGPFGKMEIRGIEIGKPARLIEIEKDAQNRIEELKKKAKEMREKARGPLFGGEKKSVEEKAEAEEKTEKKEIETPKSEDKDLIKT